MEDSDHSWKFPRCKGFWEWIDYPTTWAFLPKTFIFITPDLFSSLSVPYMLFKSRRWGGGQERSSVNKSTFCTGMRIWVWISGAPFKAMCYTTNICKLSISTGRGVRRNPESSQNSQPSLCSAAKAVLWPTLTSEQSYKSTKACVTVLKIHQVWNTGYHYWKGGECAQSRSPYKIITVALNPLCFKGMESIPGIAAFSMYPGEMYSKVCFSG